jgi:hypothetical protein
VSNPMNDPVLGKIVVDFSRKYVSVYLCEGDGTIKDFDHVKWPIRLDTPDARGECRDMFDRVYQWALDNVLAELQEEDDDGPD